MKYSNGNDHIDDNSQYYGIDRNNHNNKRHLHRDFPLAIKLRKLLCPKFIKARIVIRMIIFPMKLWNLLKRVDAFLSGCDLICVAEPCRNS